ncbi:hypothetical protein A0J61_09954 [Choanephora cucurbitarum]|uniref:Uncharacterized protein n=1 Tax=Choanephora cucurbitarum TaxID=101091 RepID=A0A1C7MYT8_9FUNG|nr:hypothetical protein A0J61_09954 [Choanephora cucurbitarum]
MKTKDASLTLLAYLVTIGHQRVSIDQLAKPTNKLPTVLMLVWSLKDPEHFLYTCKDTSDL